MKNLIVFPGLSSPYNTKYIPTYDLLREESKLRNIEINILLYPGQQAGNGKIEGGTCPNSSIEHALAVLTEYEEKKQPYQILGISYGCNISLTSSMQANSLQYCERAILWGLIPLWIVWQSFGQDKRDSNVGTGTRIIHPHQEFYYQSIPNEYLIQHAPLSVTVGIGSDDKYVSEIYMYYLHSLCGDVTFERKFHFISGCQHNVNANDSGVEQYLKLIFG